MSTFKSESEAIEWVSENTPLLIRGKRVKFEYPFVSGHASREVIKHLGQELYKLLNEKP